VADGGSALKHGVGRTDGDSKGVPTVGADEILSLDGAGPHFRGACSILAPNLTRLDIDPEAVVVHPGSRLSGRSDLLLEWQRRRAADQPADAVRLIEACIRPVTSEGQ
jgi:hypothetical protein